MEYRTFILNLKLSEILPAALGAVFAKGSVQTGCICLMLSLAV